MSSTGESFRRGYYGTNQCQVPFQWEVQPGKPKPKDPPKGRESVPVTISPPPGMKSQSLVQRTKPATNKAMSCFYTNPMKTQKAKKAKMANEMVVQRENDILDQPETSDDDLFSISLSPCASKSSTSNSAKGSSSSKALAPLRSSKFINLVKWFRKRFT